MTRIVVNGDPTEVAADTTLTEVLARLGAHPGGAGIAVARNGAVVPRGDWPTTRLAEADRIEVLGATQGG